VHLSSNVILLNLPSQQVLAVNADNMSSNNTQGESLADMPNSFNLENCVHCFNHTLQLSAKTLLHPFNIGLGKGMEDGDGADADDLLGLDDDEDEDEDKDEDEDEDEDKDEDEDEDS